MDDDAALRWFTTEYPVLIAALELAERAGLDDHTWRLACALTEVFERLGRWDDWSAAHAAGLAAARRLGDRSAQARCLAGWGRSAMWLRSWSDARDRLTQALELFTSLGDVDGQARTHHNLGYLHEHQGGDLEPALHHSSRALELFRECGDLAGVARALNAVGWYESLLGRPDDAVVHCREALAVLQLLGDRRTEALTWDSLAHAHLGRCEHALAVECFDRAIAMMVALGDPFHEAEIADHLGDAYAAVGDTGAAGRAWRRSLERWQALGHPRAEAMRAKLARIA